MRKIKLINTEGLKILTFNFAPQPRVYPLSKMLLPYMDLTICISGEMHYILDGEPICVKAGDAILIPQGSSRERLETDKPSLYASFNIRFDEKKDFAVSGLIKNCVTPYIILLLENFKTDFATISKNKKKKCLSTFSYIYYQITEEIVDKENPHVRAIKQYICDNLSAEITIDDIAGHIHLAPQYICSLFKKETGTTIMSYVISMRIDLAKRLLVTQSEPIYVIAGKCGFSDYNYFSHTFKKVTGMSAASFRKARLTVEKSTRQFG